MEHTAFTGSVSRKPPGAASRIWRTALALLLCLPVGMVPAYADTATDSTSLEAELSNQTNENLSSEATDNGLSTPSVENPTISAPPPR